MTDVKERILAHIEPSEVIELARSLVRIPSYTTDETPVAEFLHGFLQREGIESALQEVDPGRFQTIARRPGSGGGTSLMFDGRRPGVANPAAGNRVDVDVAAGGYDETSPDRWTSVEQIVTCSRVFGATIADICS